MRIGVENKIMNQNTLVVNRFHCVKCKRFLAKFVAGNDTSVIMLPCSNCKETNYIILNKKKIGFCIKSKTEFKEPDGSIFEEELVNIMKDCKFVATS